MIWWIKFTDELSEFWMYLTLAFNKSERRSLEARLQWEHDEWKRLSEAETKRKEKRKLPKKKVPRAGVLDLWEQSENATKKEDPLRRAFREFVEAEDRKNGDSD